MSQCRHSSGSTKETDPARGPERLIADHGIDGVSKCDRSVQRSGHGDNSTILSRFRSKEFCIEAIFDLSSHACADAGPDFVPERHSDLDFGPGFECRVTSSSSGASSATAATCASSATIFEHGGQGIRASASAVPSAKPEDKSTPCLSHCRRTAAHTPTQPGHGDDRGPRGPRRGRSSRSDVRRSRWPWRPPTSSTALVGFLEAPMSPRPALRSSKPIPPALRGVLFV